MYGYKLSRHSNNNNDNNQNHNNSQNYNHNMLSPITQYHQIYLMTEQLLHNEWKSSTVWGKPSFYHHYHWVFFSTIILTKKKNPFTCLHSTICAVQSKQWLYTGSEQNSHVPVLINQFDSFIYYYLRAEFMVVNVEVDASFTHWS